jgi:hypothetical protein
MKSVSRRMLVAGLLAAGLLGGTAQPAAAIHQGATVDCGSAGIYTLSPRENSVGAFPSFSAANVLDRDGKPAGTLITFAYSVNGDWFDQPGAAEAPVGQHVGFTTCTFTAANGFPVVLVGVLNLR